MSSTVGTVKTSDTLFCTRCGSAYQPARDRFCARCGLLLTPGLSEPTRITELKKRPRSDKALILISSTFLFLVYVAINPGLAVLLDLLFTLPVLLTWAIWNFAADKITRIVIHGFLPTSKLIRSGHVKLVFRVDDVTSPKHHVLFILRKSFLPLVLV